MKTIVRLLNEGIVHLEDLSIDKFLDTVKNISEFYCSEKVDGANLWFGLDENGEFYTTREQKGRDKDRKYKASDYNLVSAYNGFRSAHEALESKEYVIKQHFSPGDSCEVEVVFGKQPNVVKYSKDGTNYIVLLRPVQSTRNESYYALAKALNGDSVTVQSVIIDTVDGESLIKTKEPFKWKFVKNISERVTKSLISSKQIEDSITALEDFLNEHNDTVSSAIKKDVSNFDVLTMKLVGIAAESKETVKLEKERLSERVLIDFKLPIKRSMMDDLMKNGNFLSNKLGKNPKDKDLEGFVLTDKNSKTQIKIVDRDLFTSINEFNYKIRNELNGVIMSDDIDAPIENRGGVFGTAKIRIANLFDLKELAKSARAKKIFASYRGETPEETVRNFVKTLKITDFQQYRTKIAAILSDTEKELKDRLEKFKIESLDYSVKLKSGKIVKFSDESRKRTLLAFAELKREILDLKKSVKESSTIDDLIFAIYGRFVEDIHKKDLAESIISKRHLVENKMELSLIKYVSTLNEDGEGGEAAPAEPAPACAGATTADAIASYPQRMFNGKILKRIKRNYFPKKKFHK